MEYVNMDKKLIGLIIVIIIGIVAVSGCIENGNGGSENNTFSISENEALNLAKESFHENNPKFLGEIDENSSFTKVSLTTFDGKEMYNVTLHLNLKGIKDDAWTYLLVDANNGTVMPSGEYYKIMTITAD